MGHFMSGGLKAMLISIGIATETHKILANWAYWGQSAHKLSAN